MQPITDNISQVNSREEVYQLLDTINDPEIPVLSISDLGIVRNVKINNDQIEIFITPTYSGCPAMDVIAMQIKMKLLEKGIKNFKITQQLSPAWTTDWMTNEGKEKLAAYGIAPPTTHAAESAEMPVVMCPLCHSNDTKLLSQFGSTACKALYQCNNCKEPFDHFKCH